MRAVRMAAEISDAKNAKGWKPRWVEVDAQRFYARSGWEANYGCYLAWLRQRGHILRWKHEPSTFWFKGIRRGVVSYKPDFLVIELSGREVYHEVKGFMDPQSATKLKRMALYYPNTCVLVIDRKAYADIRDKVGGLVPGWK